MADPFKKHIVYEGHTIALAVWSLALKLSNADLISSVEFFRGKNWKPEGPLVPVPVVQDNDKSTSLHSIPIACSIFVEK